MGMWVFDVFYGFHTAVGSCCSHLCLSNLGKLVVTFIFNKRLRCLSLILFSLMYYCLRPCLSFMHFVNNSAFSFSNNICTYGTGMLIIKMWNWHALFMILTFSLIAYRHFCWMETFSRPFLLSWRTCISLVISVFLSMNSLTFQRY